MMPDWLRDSFHSDADISLIQLALRQAVALALGCVVAGIYRCTHGKGNGSATGLITTLVLLTVLIGMVTMVIGNSVARAFSLVGALSIVRFRTVVEDTRDTAFVIFAVAVGMSVGAGMILVPIIGIPFVGLAAFLFRPQIDGAFEEPREFILHVRIGAGHSPEALLREPFGKHVTQSILQGTSTARQGTAIDLTYQVQLRDAQSLFTLVQELNTVDGVQEAELRHA